MSRLIQDNKVRAEISHWSLSICSSLCSFLSPVVSGVLALWKCAVNLSSFPSTHSTVQFTVTANLFALAEMWDWWTHFPGTLSFVQWVSSARCYPFWFGCGICQTWTRIVSSQELECTDTKEWMEDHWFKSIWSKYFLKIWFKMKLLQKHIY